MEVEDAGHFQFVDAPTTIQRSVCTEGRASSDDVKGVAYGAMVAWAELTVRRVCVTRACPCCPLSPLCFPSRAALLCPLSPALRRRRSMVAAQVERLPHCDCALTRAMD